MADSILNYIGIAKESTFNTGVVPTVFAPIDWGSDGLSINKDIKFVEAMNGTLLKNKCAFVGKTENAGKLSASFFPHVYGNFILSAMGNISTALVAGETVVYKHTFTQNTNRPSYSITQRFDTVIQRFTGFQTKSFKISASSGEVVKFELEGMASNVSTVSDVSPSYETNCPFNHSQVTKMNLNTLNLLNDVSSFEVEYNNNLESFYNLGSTSGGPSVHFGKQTEMNGKLTTKVSAANLSLLTDYLALTAGLLEFEVTGKAIGTVSFQKLYIKIPKAQITAYPFKHDEGLNMVELEFSAILDTTADVSIELTNTLASY